MHTKMEELYTIKLNDGKEIESIFTLNLKDSLKRYFGVIVGKSSYTASEFEEINQKYISSMAKILQLYDKTMREVTLPSEKPTLKKPKKPVSQCSVKDTPRIITPRSKQGQRRDIISSLARRLG